jgi:hypothetical protein
MAELADVTVAPPLSNPPWVRYPGGTNEEGAGGDVAPDLGLCSGAGDENRTRTVSLGTRYGSWLLRR